MTFYFCIGDLLTQLEKSGEDPAKSHALINVSSIPIACSGFREDAFVLASTPDLLDMDKSRAPQQLSALLDNIPLYRINMELALDRALAERHKNALVQAALEKAFGGKALPTTMHAAADERETMAGGLRHPMLGHAETGELCRFYISFLQAIGVNQNDYSFEKDILGRHPVQFLAVFGGYIINGAGAVRADTLLGFGSRMDHDPGRPLEACIEEGTRRAKSMRPGQPQEVIWAWLEADHYQMRRCADIHRLLSLTTLSRRPNWLRNDVFAILEREAMKQVFAAHILTVPQAMEMVSTAPLVKKAMQDNSAEKVDERLQTLLAQVLNADTGYAGAAGKFAHTALERETQAKQIKFV
ncbi:MAG TPA: hypothetical protein VIG74_01700 [Alphaproteobacteria bacterium]|jgi:hypothetical protein